MQFNTQLMEALAKKFGQAKAVMPMVPGAGMTHSIAGTLLDKLRGEVGADANAPAPGPSYSLDEMQKAPVPTPPTSAVPAVNKSVISAPVGNTPAPTAQTPVQAPQMPSNGYDDAARQQLYADLAQRMKRGAGFQALGGLADTISRAGGSKETEYSKNIGEQVRSDNKTSTEQFEAGRKGVREELADYLKQKIDSRDFAFKEKEAGLKHEEIKAAREANMLLKQQMLADRAAKTKEASDLKLDKMIQRHTEGLEKGQIPQLLNAYNELIPQFMSGKDVAGIGMADQMVPGAMLSQQGKANRMRLQQMANVFLKLRSGAAVTDPEYARFLNESYAGKIPTEAAARQWLKHMGSDMKLAMGLAESGLPPEALEEYKGRPNAVKLEDIYGSQTPQAPQAAPKQHPQDNEAVTWAKANPNDPRAAKILAANGL